MPIESAYETFRTVLTMNLCSVVQDPDVLRGVLEMVDVSMSDFEISKKQMEIIPAQDMTPVIKCYLGSKAVSSLSMGTLKQYRYKLTHFFDTVRKSYMDIRANDIRLYLYNFKIERNASDSYLDNVRITLNSFFRWLVENEYLQKNPCAKVDKIKYQPKRREPLSAIQLEEVRWNTAGVREKALIDFFFSTGCRVSECADVRLSDINWDLRSVHIRNGKGRKERTVYFNAEAEVSLREYLKTRSDDTDALFVSVKSPHQQLQSHALENIIKKVSRRTGISVFPHKLRHTFATAGLRGGMPLEQIQALLGHSDPKTTLIYAKQDQSELQHEHRRIYA
jgi:integrase/recombinase XerD